MYDVAVIGAGIIGSAVARELSKYHVKAAVIERENDVATGSTKANSAILHAGYDPACGTKMAKHNVRGSKLAKELCRRLSVPYKQIGSLVLAFDDADMETVRKLYDRGVQNGVEGMKILTLKEVLDKEPNINSDIKGALWAPSCAIVNPWEYAIALAENAHDNGVDFYLDHRVTGIEKRDGAFVIRTVKEPIEAKYVINAAGVYADKINNMVGGNEFTITANKGSYFLLDKSQGNLVHTVVFQCPSRAGKGVLVSPTVHGNLIVGPDAVDVDDREDRGTPKASLDYVREMSQRSCPSISFRDNIRNFAGLRAQSSEESDFLIEESRVCPGFINLSVIKSPGLTSAPSIAEEAVEILEGMGLELIQKEQFIADRQKVVFKELSVEEKEKIVKENPLYGRIICRCETVTEGEIVDALKSPLCPPSLDAVKRRAGSGMGRCQGGFCGPRVAEIISREKGVPMMEILQDRTGSNILVAQTKTEGGSL